MTAEKLKRALDIDKKREYYEAKLYNVEEMQKLVDKLRNSGREVFVSIGDAPHVTAYLNARLVDAFLSEAKQFYAEKKHEVEDEFSKL